MKSLLRIAGPALATLLLAGFGACTARAQDPTTIIPIVTDLTRPIVMTGTKPQTTPTGLAKFEGYVMHANIAQITVRALGNDLAIQTFPLSQAASQKMQQIIDKGGYQYGDKVTVLYDPTTHQAAKIKGKPSKAL
jgi:hypothetical protein